MREVTVSGHTFNLDRGKVERALRVQLPEPIRDHFVVALGKRWPPKQVLSLVTGLDRADFTTHQARRVLMRLGFTAGRAARRVPVPHAASSRSERDSAGLVEALRPFVGQWVAVKGDDVLVAAPTPARVVAWLAEHDQRAESMFRVPDSEQAVGGAAPL